MCAKFLGHPVFNSTNQLSALTQSLQLGLAQCHYYNLHVNYLHTFRPFAAPGKCCPVRPAPPRYATDLR